MVNPIGHLSHRYDSVYHDAKNNELKGSSLFEDGYEKVGNHYIMSRRLIQSEKDGQPEVIEFFFPNIKLLQPVAV